MVSADAASEVAARCASVATHGGASTGLYGSKPHYFGEFGLKGRLAETIDRSGLHLHNAFFASAASGCAGYVRV